MGGGKALAHCPHTRYRGKLPTIIINRTGKNPYDARLIAMFIFTLFPLLTLFAQPLCTYSYWFPIILIGLAGAAHQSWSANLFSVASDLFPKKAIGTMTGINGLAGGISSFTINKLSGELFKYADETQMTFLGFEGKPAGYFIIFCYCAVAYILGWTVLKILVPKYKAVKA
jgi:ACS family hexuronate transporter-like MFS transporter